MKLKLILAFTLLSFFIFIPANITLAQTDSVSIPDTIALGSGNTKKITEEAKNKRSIEELGALVGKNEIALNMVWVLLAGFLVMFMQAGFALVETGLTRAKNVMHTMAMNTMVYAIGMIGFWICGFALMFGGVGTLSTLGGSSVLSNEFTIDLFGKTFGLFGMNGFMLSGSNFDMAIFALFLFQMVFMDTAATIPTGSMAERWKFLPFIIFAFFMSMFLYPIYGNWVWGGGWLSQLGNNFGLGHGVVDFAGSAVVHMVGGWTALAGAIVLGPRIGKFNKNGSANIIPGHNIPMAAVGVFILAFGWFGFNAGSTLAGTDTRIALIAVNTMLAGSAGAITAMIYTWMKSKKPDFPMSLNGLLAGLVAITAPCAFVNSVSAVIIGAIAGVLVVLAAGFIENKLKVDDPVGAVAVHGVNGAWGIIALGLFADGTYGDGLNGVTGAVTGLFYGDGSQLIAQLIGIIVNIVFVFLASYSFFKLLDKLMGMRVSKEAEIEGLDIPEMGALGYPEALPEYSPARSTKK